MGVLGLAICLLGSVQAVCPLGDLNGDCKVDLEDLQIFAEQWLVPAGSTADLDGDDEVAMTDLALLAGQWYQARIPLMINEFMASNSKTAQDEQGEYDDWIEIYNAADYAINVAGMYLTDDLDQPTRWQILANNPAATTIPAHGYLLIWADEGIGSAWGGALHANFKLVVEGEQIALFDRDGSTLIDSISFDEQTVDISYGRYPDGGRELQFLANPTPAAQNSDAYLGAVAEVKFSHKRGFYNAPFSVTLSTQTEGATILYTLNGSVPDDRSYRVYPGKTYTGPILIDRTTCLRAIAVKPGWKSSKIETHTYILNASAVLKSLPIVSLVGDPQKTFYEPEGIMAIVGGYYGSDGRWVSSSQNSYNNPMRRGRAYERPVSFEFINPPDVRRINPPDVRWIKPQEGTGFQVDCGIRVHGSDWMRPRYRRCDGYWTGDCKFSFRLYFRGQYGQSWLEYPLFPFQVDRFQSIVLRGGHNDRVNPFIKDELLRRLHKDMGHIDSGGIMANLLINGEYKGYFNPCEHIREAFCQQWYQSDKAWDVMTMNGVGDGDSVAWNALLNYAGSHDLSNYTYYQELAKQLDIAAFADYLIIQLWSGNWDWPQNNWIAARERSDEGIWRFYIWDAEGGMFADRLNTVYFDRVNSQSGPIAQLYRALKASSNFRQIFCDRVYKHFYNYGALTDTKITKRFLELRDEALGVIPSMDMYVLNTWVPNRLKVFLDACTREGLFTFAGPTFNVNGLYQHGGQISDGDILTITYPRRSGVLYYTLDGVDPRLPTTSQGTGGPTSAVLIQEDAAKRVLVPARPVSDNWKGGAAFDDSAWISGIGGIGYETESGYQAFINIDLRQQMYNQNTTCYIRIPSTVTSTQLSEFTRQAYGGLNFMTLGIRYDDGFVAYINGIEVARRNFTGSPAPNSAASAENPDSSAVVLETVDISAHISALRSGSNILAVQGLNISSSDSDFLISAELIAGRSPDFIGASGVSPTAIRYTGPITLTRSMQVKARILDRGTWSALNEATFAVGPVAENLRITEIMYHPPDTDSPSDANKEFIELKNTCPEPVEGVGSESINLNLARFTNGIDFTFPSIELAAGKYVLIVKDQAAFYAQYPDFAGIIAGQYAGSLANEGERIRLEDAIGQTIMDFRYSDAWRDITDGGGFSLTIVNPANPDINSWGEKDSWRASAFYGGSPGWDDTGIVPEPGSVVINEVLAHSHADSSDWIELHNTTGEAINIGGWFLSDDGNDPSAVLGTGLTKYQIADGTVIAANSYIVFYQDQHFGNPADPGCHRVFALSENGDQVYLSSAQDGILTGYQEVEDFGASETGVAFGRYYKGSTDNYNFVAMSQNTPGLPNAYPKVGPIVINEIMYNPGSGDQNEEYIELFNISSQPVDLYRYDKSEAWRFTDGIEFVFLSEPVVTIPAGGYLLVVKHLDSFVARYGLPLRLASQDAAAGAMPAPAGSFRTETNLEGPAGVVVVGPYDGQLKNGGEKLELSMPGDVDALGTRHYIRVDRVNFSDGSHPEDQPGGVDLWPVEADGGGLSLSRRFASAYGNDVANWKAAPASPGFANPRDGQR